MKVVFQIIFFLFLSILNHACSQEINTEETTSSNNLVVQKLIEEGDNLEKTRQVDHWLYFPTDADRENSKFELINLGYKIESEGLLKGDSMPFELNISKIESVKLEDINKITELLNSISKKYNGDYDGWETYIIKD